MKSICNFIKQVVNKEHVEVMLSKGPKGQNNRL